MRWKGRMEGELRRRSFVQYTDQKKVLAPTVEKVQKTQKSQKRRKISVQRIVQVLGFKSRQAYYQAKTKNEKTKY